MSSGRGVRRHPQRWTPLRALASARLRAALGLGVVLSGCATGTFAYWTDSAAVSGETFSAGTLDLKVNDLDQVASYTSMNLDTMVPGSSVAGVLTISNAGTAPLTYTAETSATDADGKDLRGSLTVKVTGASSTTGTMPAMTCGGTPLPDSASTLNGPLIPTARALAAGASEDVCVQVGLDADAPSGLQGATTDVVITFNAMSDLP